MCLHMLACCLQAPSPAFPLCALGFCGQPALCSFFVMGAMASLLCLCTCELDPMWWAVS